MSAATPEASAIGLIAGAGQLPIEAARLLRETQGAVTALGFEGVSEPELSEHVDHHRLLRLGQMKALAEALSELGIERVVMLGKVPKSLLLAGDERVAPDAEAIRLLSTLSGRGDDALMGLLAGWLEGRGVSIASQAEVLSPLLAERGSLGAREPGESERRNLSVGLPVLRSLGEVGVGQCVVVKDGMVLAVEAIEGTDATIRRAGVLGGPGATVIKGIRPDQDRRFDLPAVGPDTLAAMREAGATALAIEAGASLIIDRTETLARARAAEVSVFGFDRAGSGT